MQPRLIHYEKAPLLLVRAYQTGILEMTDEYRTRSVILVPYYLPYEWKPKKADELNKSSFDYLLEVKPDLVLFGIGSHDYFLDPAYYSQLLTRGINVEVMTTGPACRLYNNMALENRSVAAALFLT